MKVLIACEFSGIVREAFRALGHNAWSCDLLLPEISGPHLQGDVREFLDREWDLMIAHPPCTYLCNSGVRWLYHPDGSRNVDRWREMKRAALFFAELLHAPIPRICVENPIMHGHAQAIVNQRHTQIVHPWQFGHGETKSTCLWLKDLPPLTPTKIVKGRKPRVHHASPGKDRWKERSRTLKGIAAAMARQWGAKP